MINQVNNHLSREELETAMTTLKQKALEEKVELITRLDKEILEMVDEGELDDEVRQADTVQEAQTQ